MTFSCLKSVISLFLIFHESMKNEKESCWYRKILIGGRLVAKERKEIESLTESGTEFEITFIFDKPKNFSKLKIMLLSLSFKAEKKGKKRKEKMIYSGKNKQTENCDTRTYNIISRNFEKSSSLVVKLIFNCTSYAIYLGNFQFYPRFFN